MSYKIAINLFQTILPAALSITMTSLYKKINDFYIDETGNLENDQNIFAIGCLKTDSAESLEEKLKAQMTTIQESLYFFSELAKLKKTGFHAVDNHFDIRALMYQMIPLVNFRSYFVTLNKNDKYFEELKQSKGIYQIYSMMVKKLVKGRLQRNTDHNRFHIEELQLPKVSQKKILEEIFEPYLKNGNVEYNIVGKEKLNMAYIDYMNFVLFGLLNDPKSPMPVMVKIFDLIQPKIGLVNHLNTNQFFNRKTGIDLQTLQQLFSGTTTG